ncbi:MULTISPECIES: N-acetyltransferase [unclassified Streptomyces]|uniref:GNAT family N-acetyltransferase n=1 Tax=unclassified Streptomyces TaxID=2593676 RepID=UPI00215650E0|nr:MULTISPECIES: GNAT family N-acetyltransferase [unclassified Streptomyces]
MSLRWADPADSISRMAYRLRETRGADWSSYRRLRLAALRDPAAPVAFFEPVEQALRRTSGEWTRHATSNPVRTTFVVEGADEDWAGMATALVTDDGHVHIVGVYVRPEQRGTGLAERLMRAAIDWSGAREVRLDVHEDNERAARFYRRLGFLPTGRSTPDPRDPTLRTVELSLAVQQSG